MRNRTHVLIAAVAAVQVVLAALAAYVLRHHAIRLDSVRRSIGRLTARVDNAQQQIDSQIFMQTMRASIGRPAPRRRHLTPVTTIRPDGAR